MRQEIHAVNSGSVARHHLWASVSIPLYQHDAQLVSEPSTTLAHTVLSITLAHSGLQWDGIGRTAESIPFTLERTASKRCQCLLWSVTSRLCRSSSAQGGQVHVAFVWWPSGITVVGLLCMKAKVVLHGDDFFHGVFWEDRQCERIKKGRSPAGRSVQGLFMIGDWRARSSMVSQVFRRGVPRWRGLRRRSRHSPGSSCVECLERTRCTRDICTVGPNLRSVIGLIT